MSTYLPVILFFAALTAVLFMTASDRAMQIRTAQEFGGRITRLRPKDLFEYLTPVRIIGWLVILFSVLFFIHYQMVKKQIEGLMTEKEYELTVGTIVIPFGAMFRNEFIVESGFSRRKRRERADVQVTGNVISGIRVSMEDINLAKLSTLTGKAFVFNYLSDVKVLEPAIKKYMKRTINSKQITHFEIETFDNRGPYILVVLGKRYRKGDLDGFAEKIAKGLFKYLTGSAKLQVNQVVIKAIDPAKYERNKTIKVIARGQAGSY